MPESAMPDADEAARTYTWRGVAGPFDVVVDPGVFVPSSTSKVLAEALRVDPGDIVVDAGCGCGVLSLVAAKLGAAKVIGTDLSARLLRVLPPTPLAWDCPTSPSSAAAIFSSRSATPRPTWSSPTSRGSPTSSPR